MSAAAIPFHPARRTERQVMDAVQALVGHRCYCEGDEAGCVLGADMYDGPEFSVVFHAECRDPSFPFVAYSMCNDCVSDVRRTMSNDIHTIRTENRGKAKENR